MLDEGTRLRILRELGTTLSGTNGALQAVAQLAGQLCGTPMAAVSLVAADEQVFVGAAGLDVTRTDRASSFCAVAMDDLSSPLLVPDTHADERFAGNALVVGAPFIRAYAGMPVVAEEGVPLGAVCVLSDRPHVLSGRQLTALRALGVITERLLQADRLTEKLQATVVELAGQREAELVSQAQFRTAFDHATAGLTLVDDRGVYVRVNRAFAELLGYTVEELTGLSFRDITVEADQDSDLAAVAELVSGARRASLREKQYRHRDGGLIPALVSSSLIQPAPGGPWQLLNSVESLAERRAAEARLLELHSAVDGIISIDEDRRVVAWNRGAERMLGYAAADMIGRPLDRIIPLAVRPAHHVDLAQLAAGDVARLTDTTTEVPVVHADGHELLTELSLTTWTRNDRPLYTAILRDITAQRRAEQAAALIRFAAETANAADTFAAAAAAVISDVCVRLGWRAGHAWIRHDDQAAWHVADHDHIGTDHAPDDADLPCPLLRLAALGSAPTPDELPFDTTTRVAGDPRDLAAMGPAVRTCGIGAAIAVPVLAGGEVTGTIAFYLPAGSSAPTGDLVTALEQVGLALGRVVERQRTRAALIWQAGHDPVTDLANRRLLLDQISEVQRTFGTRPQRRSAVLLVNLDRFRMLNDSFGYAAGDQVLRDVAARLRGAVRDGDLVARLSADEFVLLVHHTASTEPGTAGKATMAPFTALAERVLRLLDKPVNLVGHQLPLRASIGICPITADHAAAVHHPARVLRDADAALRHAKRRGKNQIHVFDTVLASTAAQRLDTETALAYAITAGQLLLHCDYSGGRRV